MKFLNYYLLLIFALLAGCKKDAPVDPLPPFETNPYNFPAVSNFRTFEDDTDNPLTEEGVDLGHHLFFDTRLSKNFSMSCSSCHQPEHGFSDPDRFSTGVDGIQGVRQSMSLLNLAWSGQFFWDGRAATLRDQALIPVPDPIELHLEWQEAVSRLQSVPAYVAKFKKAFNTETISEQLVARALEQYIKSLVVYHSDFDKHVRGEQALSAAALRGQLLFNSEKADCFHCHTTPELMVHASVTFMNNGLDLIDNADGYADKGLGAITGNSSDNGKFKIPSLRNLPMTAPYMHDGRFNTLEEVVDFYNEGPKMSPSLEPIMIAEANRRILQFGRWGLGLTQEEKNDLIEFLKSLSDDSYLTNPHFKAPVPLK